MICAPKYIIDSNILIESSRLDYGFDICPGFWSLMLKGFETGLVLSHRKVLDELKRGTDDLSEWVKNLSPSVFPEENEEEFVVYRGLCDWSVRQAYRETAVATFCDNDYADPWICAKAKCMQLTLVTQEKSEPLAKRNVKLPDACKSIGVPFINKYELLRRLMAKFVLDATHEFDEAHVG